MLHRNYVYDTERRYNKALEEGFADSVTRQFYAAFCQAKRSLEKADRELCESKSLVRCGQSAGWYAVQQARRRYNGAECELSILSRRISLRILRLRNASSERAGRSA